jgi:hypothetical protein
MKRMPAAAALAAMIACVAWAMPLAGRVQGQAPVDLRVMTYNLQGE